MESEAKVIEPMLMQQMSKEHLTKLLMDLVNSSPKLRRAILQVVWTCPNIVKRI